MLVLTRRPNESIVIGDILITVVSVGPGRVKLGIQAPPHVRVNREEVQARIEPALGAGPAPEPEPAPAVGMRGRAARVLRSIFARAPVAVPKRHSEQTPQCVPLSRFVAVAHHGAELGEAERAHTDGCAFCARNLALFLAPPEPESGAEMMVVETRRNRSHPGE